MSARFVTAAVLALSLAGCGRGLGEACSASDACPEDLVCTFPQVGGAPAAQGICDYPLKPAGEACTSAAECEGTLTCSTHFAVDDRSGPCVDRRAPGEACGVNRDCASNRCRDATPGSANGTCQ